jgi:hypothetical protein
MALKKTVKKRRRAKRKVVSMETIVEALQANITLSPSITRSLNRLTAADKAVARQDKTVEINSGRVDKARLAVGNAKTVASKEKAKVRLVDAQAKLKEAKAERSAAVAEQRKAARLAKDLDKAIKGSQARMVKEFEKAAKSLEKAIDKRTRRRRRTTKKKATPAA